MGTPNIQKHFSAIGAAFTPKTGSGYALSLTERYASIRLQRCMFSGGLWIQAFPGQTIEIVDCTFQSLRFRPMQEGHAIIVTGLAGSTPKDVPINLRIFNNNIVCGEDSNVEDAINLISVRGAPGDYLIVGRNTITGTLNAKSGAETAICIDRYAAYVKVVDNIIDVASSNVAINCAGGSHVWIARNRVRGRGRNSAINAYNHYGYAGDSISDVRIVQSGPDANIVEGTWPGKVWLDLAAVGSR